MRLRAAVRATLRRFPALLARLGLLDRRKGLEAFDLAVPVMVTGGLRVLLRVVDFLMVGVAVGDTGIAALEFGFQYYFLGFGLSLALSSGTISVVSRLQGGSHSERANLAVKQSLWLSLALSVPVTVATWGYARPLVDVLTDDPAAIRLGATYLRVVMLSLAFRFWSMIAARALAGSADTRTPMYVRLLTLPTNVVLNAVLIFGPGPAPELGVAGAAWGTAVANTLAAVVFVGLLVSGRYVVRLPLAGPQFDRRLCREILRVALPLAGTRVLQTLGRFPFLFVLGVLGTPVVAAYAIGRRVMLFALMPAWGYKTSASTLVGQSLGAGEDREAAAYGWQTLRVAVATQVVLAAVLVVAARPLSLAFGTDSPATAATFIRAFGLLAVGFAVSRTMRGCLRGAGDTRWPLYATVAGIYCFQLPVALLALPVGHTMGVGGLSVTPGLGLGLSAVFVALVGQFYVQAGVNAGRFRAGGWRRVADAADLSGDD